jgi:hypothetical protein
MSQKVLGSSPSGGIITDELLGPDWAAGTMIGGDCSWVHACRCVRLLPMVILRTSLTWAGRPAGMGCGWLRWR